MRFGRQRNNFPLGNNCSSTDQVGAVEPPGSSYTLIKILDPVTSFEFLIDTGSSASLISHKMLRPVTPTGCLMAINGTHVPTYGACQMKVSLGLNKKLNWSFTIG